MSITLENSDTLRREINSVFIFRSRLAFGSNILKCGAHLCFRCVISETGSVLTVEGSCRLCAESRGHVRREHKQQLRGRGRNLVCGKPCDPTPSLKHLRGSFYDFWASTITVRAPALKFVASELHFIPFLRTFCMFAASLNTSFSSWVSQFPLDLQYEK